MPQSFFNIIRARLSGLELTGNLDLPTPHEHLKRVFKIAGWAIFKQAELASVEIWLDEVPLLEQARVGLSRPDIDRQRLCGFEAQVVLPALVPPGPAVLKVVVKDTVGRAQVFARPVQVTTLPDAIAASPLTAITGLYQTWIARHEIAPPAQPAPLAFQPFISILMPVYDPPPEVLRQALDSVLAQTYQHWELCVVDATPASPAITALLDEAARTDRRIRLNRPGANLGIAGNSEIALGMAGGEFVALLDHDDTLAPEALYKVGLTLNDQPSTDFIYSDHDLLSEDGTYRFAPLFKPDYSSATLLSANYLTHLTVIRTAVARQAGGFKAAPEGAQDWDLFWRVLERTRMVYHIPEVLYHWRVSPRSTATNLNHKPNIQSAQCTVLENHLARTGHPARVYFNSAGFLQLDWQIPPAALPRVDLILVAPETTTAQMPAVSGSLLEATTYPGLGVLAGATGPLPFGYTPVAAPGAPAQPLCYLPLPANLQGYARKANWLAGHSRAEWLVFLDYQGWTIRDGGWLAELVAAGEASGVGLVVPRMLDLSEAGGQEAGWLLGMHGWAGPWLQGVPPSANTPYGFGEWYRDCATVNPVAFAVRRTVFEALNGFDPRFGSMVAGVDLGLRAHLQGHRIIYNPFARLFRPASSSCHFAPDEISLFKDRYPSLLGQGDPFASPHLFRPGALPVRWFD